MKERERWPMETYNAGASFGDEGELHHEIDVHRDAARRNRVGAFWFAFTPCLFMAYAFADSQMATGEVWYFAWLPFALFVLLPVPSLLIARSDERLADQWDLWGHRGLERREANPPADPPAPPPTA